MMKLWNSIKVIVAKKPYISGGIGLAIVIILYLIFGRCGRKLESITNTPKDFLVLAAVSGSVKSSQNVDLGVSKAGRVSDVEVKDGDKVYEGQVLAETENGDLEANLRVEQARLASLKA